MMDRTKQGFISFILGMVLLGSGFLVSGTDIYAAVPTPTSTATRVQHITVKARHTPTPPQPTAAAITATVTTSAVPGGSIEATVQAYLEQPQSISNEATLTNTVALSSAQPVRLVIPSLQIDAVIEKVGQDQSGAMDVPSQVADVAWYGLGAKPGEVGNAVIAGHLDLADGSPAVFWPIDQLKRGDEVLVYDAAGMIYRFQVSHSQRYDYHQAPVEEIFGFSLKSDLNLITCAGAWDRTKQNYSSRLVVYTELVEVIRPD